MNPIIGESCMTKELFFEELEFLSNQEMLLKEIITDLKKVPRETKIDLLTISQSIEHLKEEIKVGKADDLPALYYQLEQQYNLAQKFSKPIDIPDLSAPYFAHMKLKSKDKIRDIFLGHCAFIPANKEYRIVDWRNAPIAQVYYNFTEGEEFEIDLPNVTLEGIVLEKNILTIQRGKLVRIDRFGKSYYCKEVGWSRLTERRAKLSGGEGKAFRELKLGVGLTDYESPDVISLLDKDQFKILNNDQLKSVILMGGAGSGKTTVALHRMAKLCYKNNYRQNSVIVMVPQRGLVRLSRNILSSIGLPRVKVTTSSNWFKNQACRLMKGLPHKITDCTPFSVSFLKRHNNVEILLETWVKRKNEEILNFLKKKIGYKIEELWNTFKKVPLVPKLRILKDHKDLTSVESIIVDDFIKELNNYNTIREEIFKDEKLLSSMLFKDQITLKNIKDTVRHTITQFKEEMGDKEFRNDTLDGMNVDYSTSSEIIGTVDEDDYAFLLLVARYLNGDITTDKGYVRKYNHIVLDEAQELSSVDLKVLSSIRLTEKSSYTVAGDSSQRIDETVHFTGWKNVWKKLEVDEGEIKELMISYRSSQEIMDFAYDVLGPLAPPTTPTCTKKGYPVLKTLVPYDAHIMITLNEALEELLVREPKASIALILNKQENALSYYNSFKNLVKIRLVENSEFTFKPGIDVTTVDQIKGLEFDYVIIPDADINNYPVHDIQRRRMHLASTRAIHQLWVLASKSYTSIMPIT